MKTYINKAQCKEINLNFWNFYNMSFNIEELQKIANNKGYINITMSKRKESDQYGNTHYFTLNEWTPDKNSATSTENKDEFDSF